MLFSSESPDKLLDDPFNVSRETMERLKIYHALLLKWQKKTNLIAPSTIEEFWSRHVADSIQCRRIKPDAMKWVDIGSGGGFPGMVIAAELIVDHTNTMTLVESNTKKCAFLREVARETGVKVVIKNERIEAFISKNNAPDIVTARALAKLSTLMEYCYPWLAGNSVGLFHKGRDYRQELEESHDKWVFDLIEHPSKIAAESVILEISNLKRR